MSWVSLQWKIIHIRAPHRCGGCWRTFPIGAEMRKSAGMWDGDTPQTNYYCLVCDSFISDADLCEYPDDSFPSDCWATLSDYREQYAKIEAKHATYIIRAGVPNQREWLALGSMYDDLRMGVRWREFDAQKGT